MSLDAYTVYCLVRKVPQVLCDDHLCSDLHGGSEHMAIFRMVGHRSNQPLMASDQRAREDMLHLLKKVRCLALCHSPGPYKALAQLTKNLLAPVDTV